MLVLQQDIVDGLRRMPGNSVHLAVADPDWQIRGSIETGRRRNRTKYTAREIEGFDWCRAGDPTTVLEQQEFMAHWISEAYRVLVPGGHLVVWYDAQRISHVYDAADARWVRRQVLCWAKRDPVPRAGCVNFMSGFELAGWLTKDTAAKGRATFHAELGQSSNLQVAPVTRGARRVHPAQKPDAICEWMVSYLSSPGDIVLDLFAGSAILGRTASGMGRRAVAIERERMYVEQCLANGASAAL